MDRLFILKLAYRNLLLHKLRTILTLTGVIIGISAVVFLISFSTGIQRLVTAQISGANAYLLIDVGTGDSQVIKLDNTLIAKIKEISGIKQIETVTNFGGKAKNSDKSIDIAVFGVSSGTYLDWSGKKIQYGQNLSADQTNSTNALINTSYAAFLTNKKPESLIGQKVTFDLILPKELSPTGTDQAFTNKEFTITGIIKDDASPSLYSNAANFTYAGASASSQLEVLINNQGQADTIRTKIEAYGLKTDYTGDTVSQVQQFFNVFQLVLGSFGLIALIVALLGMFNTLTISLLERIKEVALMQIFGMGKRDVRNLFLTEAIFLGLIGGVIGIVWGVVLGKIANMILNHFAVRAGSDAVSVFYYAPWFLISVMASALLIGFITGIYPASRASRVKPLDILRYE